MEANLRETDLVDIRPGQPAEVRVDLYGGKHTFRGTVEGWYPAPGSPFALLPPDNSTGNFIHITERVPVRIALEAEELREHPIRPGLSTVTKSASAMLVNPSGRLWRRPTPRNIRRRL